MLCAILYLENSGKTRFADIKKHVNNYYIFNNAEYPRTVTAVHRLLLNYRPNYNYNIQSQSHGVSKQLMFAQHKKTGDDDGGT